MRELAKVAAIPHSALDRIALPAEPGFSVCEAARSARLVLRGPPQIFADAGIPMPATMRAARLGAYDLLWLGPDEFLLIAPDGDAGLIAREMAAKIAGAAHSMVDVSHRQIGLRLEGSRAGQVLSAGCPLDLRLSAFPVGMVTRTIFLKAEIVLWRKEENRFYVEIWRSFAPYFVGHLKEARIAADHG